ncbi:MAG TPA: hypothetical protein PLJ27_09810 [Polyangiaceae bacterium]|jgi:hypothetical protein|nr:MAG: hypothetical protein BWY17_02068 [Deltaproteobacteria bacterium ADurb.Bin207]HNS97710.1 hypothetical protein [Polyangiaceae bacterium]HNZ24168.1 hypothetical protein [Polyangiaceae bacterium]HOD22525.1 hypothetical protein [Polyangiaceae bacterium]HOE51485.1 hypothetical protein [Polyangiaceae bacterium]
MSPAIRVNLCQPIDESHALRDAESASLSHPYGSAGLLACDSLKSCLMNRRAHAATMLALILMASPAEAQSQPASPFDANGPLAPWKGPLPSEPHPLAVIARATPDQPPTPQDEPHTTIAVCINPALTVLGKTSARLELAPLGSHALFVEMSRLSFFISELNRKVTGTEYDIGYHLFPQGQGADGFYIGPRFLFGSGEITEARWSFRGFGGDLGYQWVIAHHLVFNLGGGVARIQGKAELEQDALGLPKQIPENVSGAFSLSSQQASLWVPMLTLALGFAL